jgi:hypothetical protein
MYVTDLSMQFSLHLVFRFLQHELIDFILTLILYWLCVCVCVCVCVCWERQREETHFTLMQALGRKENYLDAEEKVQF